MPDFGSTYFLPRLVGVARAKRMIMLGEPVDARQALEWGLVDEVVPGSELMATAMRWAEKLQAKSPIALTLIKDAVNTSLDKGLDAALDLERYGQNLLLGTEEMLEKTAAFREKSSKRQ